MFILIIILSLFTLIGYFFILKPYFKIRSLKAAFQSQGYKVLVETLNFNDDTITSSIKHDTDTHKDALHRYKTTWQNYDVTIKNSFFAIYVSLNSVSLVKQAYKKIEHTQKPWMLKNNFSRFYGGGLFMKDGNDWKEKRKLYSEIFNFNLLESLHSLIEKSVQEQMKNWKINQKIDLLDHFRTMYFNTFVACYFGRHFTEFNYKDQSYAKALNKAFELLLVQAFSLRHMLFGTQFLEKGYFREDQQLQERVTAIKIQTKEFIMKRWEEIQKSNCDEKRENSILSKVLFNENFKKLSESDKQKALEDITGDVIMFFFAGNDSISATLAATLHVLAKNQQIKQKLIDQINSSSDTQGKVNHKNLKYMEAVMNEVLRLYGPLNWIFVRQITTEDFTIGGVPLSKDIILGIQTQTIHCSEKYHPKPFEFEPERFMGERNQEPYTFVSFGGGQRNCIGQYLAKMEYKVGLSELLTRYEFQANDEFVMDAPALYCSKDNGFTLRKRQNEEKIK